MKTLEAVMIYSFLAMIVSLAIYPIVPMEIKPFVIITLFLSLGLFLFCIVHTKGPQ